MKCGVMNRMENPIPQPHYTRRTLSGRWVCSVEKLKRMEKAGLLPCIKIGRDVRYRREIIEQIEKESEVR